MESIYIVECYSGERTWVGGIFDNLEAAQAKKDELHAKALLVKFNSPYCDEEDEEYLNYFFENATEMEWEEPEIKQYKKHNGIGSELIWHLSEENARRMNSGNARYKQVVE